MAGSLHLTTKLQTVGILLAHWISEEGNASDNNFGYVEVYILRTTHSSIAYAPTQLYPELHMASAIFIYIYLSRLFSTSWTLIISRALKIIKLKVLLFKIRKIQKPYFFINEFRHIYDSTRAKCSINCSKLAWKCVSHSKVTNSWYLTGSLKTEVQAIIRFLWQWNWN